ncbi:alpha/beta hydrolase family protein [Pinibacter soli]|uniref:Acetylxylan esterase n=1 Tax=Pinibacter soli TaxID=3044211 RepID=A0ABT6RFD1_9BACT|nr:acetylxylan esterase [Pinibacter soli]MDI3321141.1 acetylxylan esterase [Pinibacter soli]
MRTTITILFLVFFSQTFAQQNADEKYKKPLKQVLQEVQTKFNVRIKFDNKMVADKWVSYADWRYRENVDATLANILTPFDMKVNKENDSTYKLKEYEYYRWSVEDGQKKLNELAALYNDKETWEKRKAILKQQMLEALEISPLPAKPASKTILANKRTLGDYTIENFAIEMLPGVYVAGSIYKPAKIKGKIPVVLCPDGHWQACRYRPDCQYRCATLARLGTIAVSYDLFAWGESMLQFPYEDHRKSLAQTIQVLNTIRILDYILTLPEADTSRVAISGGSGGGSLTVLMTALDDRIKLSAPVVSLSCYMYGGCPCESGMPIHFAGGGTDNVEIAAMAAPRPMLVVSDGQDWTDHVPQIEMPYLKRMYSFYGKDALVQNVHLPTEGHDFGINKRTPLYKFIAGNFGLDLKKITTASGEIDETKVTIEKENAMYVFGDKGEKLPANAIKGFDALAKMFVNN